MPRRGATVSRRVNYSESPQISQEANTEGNKRNCRVWSWTTQKSMGGLKITRIMGVLLRFSQANSKRDEHGSRLKTAWPRCLQWSKKWSSRQGNPQHKSQLKKPKVLSKTKERRRIESEDNQIKKLQQPQTKHKIWRMSSRIMWIIKTC
jgi:hypothetical protein